MAICHICNEVKILDEEDDSGNEICTECFENHYVVCGDCGEVYPNCETCPNGCED